MEDKIKMEDIYDKFVGKTFLVTGATGMIGQNVVSLLLRLNDLYNTKIRVIANLRNMDKAEVVFNQYFGRSDFNISVSEITMLDSSEDIDYIIHTAGVTGGSKQHVEYPIRTIQTALDGTRRVLELAAEKKCKGVVYLSSLEVYGNTGFDKESIKETDFGYIDPVNVRSSYSESKRMCECMCAAYTKQCGIPTYIARLTATFGNYVSYLDNRVFAQFAKSILKKEDIVLKSPGETVRNYCDAEDAAYAFLVLLAKGKQGEAYNVANMDTEISIKDLALKFVKMFPESGSSLKFDLAEDTSKLGYAPVMRNVLDSSKLIKLGWEPMYTLDDTIKKSVHSMYNSQKRDVRG